MKKFVVPILLLAIGGVMVASAQSFSAGGCVMTDVGGVPTCICANTNGQGSVTVGSSYCSGTGAVGGGPLLQFLAMAQTVVNRLVPFLIGLAVVVFFWYLVMYIWKGDESPEKRQEGLRGMGYSLIAIFVMVSLWGIILFLGSVLGIGQGGGLPPIQMPTAR